MFIWEMTGQHATLRLVASLKMRVCARSGPVRPGNRWRCKAEQTASRRCSRWGSSVPFESSAHDLSHRTEALAACSQNMRMHELRVGHATSSPGPAKRMRDGGKAVLHQSIPMGLYTRTPSVNAWTRGNGKRRSLLYATASSHRPRNRYTASQVLRVNQRLHKTRQAQACHIRHVR